MANHGGDWDARRILDLYIYDYMKKKMPEVAEIFAKEAGVCENPLSEGFLSEWWGLFWDVFSSRMTANTEPAAESSLQRNVMGSVQQIAQQEIPAPRPDVDDQWVPQVPVSGNVDNMMMGQHSELAFLMAARQYEEQQRLNAPPPRDLNANMQLFDINQWAAAQQGQPSSSNASPHMLHQAFRMSQSQQVPRPALTQVPIAVPQQGARDNRPGPSGLNLGRPAIPDAARRGTLMGDILQKGVLLDAGKNKGVMPSPLQGRPTNVVGNSSYGMGHHILNSLPVGPQSNISLTHQPDFLNASAMMQGNPLQGSTSTAQNVTLLRDDSSGQEQVSDLLMEVPNTQTAEKQMTVTATQGEKQLKETQSRKLLEKNEKGKKRSASIALSTPESSMGVDNAEVNKPENEDIDSFLSHCDYDAGAQSNSFSPLQRDTTVSNSTGNKGFCFQEVSSFQLSNSKVLCCHFSSDGKYLASAGHEKKVLISNMDTLNHVTTAEGHSNIITDVRFRPLSTIFATSSFDRTVCLWNAARTTQSLLTLHGHAEQVLSVDFHPKKQDLVCSCDSNNEIRLWDVNRNVCTYILKPRAARQVRFQPEIGNILAAASGNAINLIDTESNIPQFKLEGHAKEVRSICWDPSGQYIASVSEDNARIWSTASGWKCIYELHSNGNKFESCTFHPGYSQLLVIGSYEVIELWNPMTSNKTMTVQAHDGIIASLADSPVQELVASASHDHYVKVWK